MARPPLRAYRGTAFISGIVLLISGLLAAPAAAVPTQDDIEQVLAETSSTEEAIRNLEVLLADNNASADEAAIEASIATEAFLVAEAELESAKAEESEAAKEKASADEELHAAANALAAIAVASYRNGGELNELEVFFTSNGVENALSAKSFLQRRGQQSDGLLQRHEAAEIIANLAAERASNATAGREDAAADLEAKADSAQARSDEATTAVAETEAQRGRLLTQLANLRNTSVEMEIQRQEDQERQRIERENSVARNNVSDRNSAEADAPEASTPGPVQDGGSAPGTPSQPSASAEPTTQAPSSPSPRPTTQAPTTAPPTTAAPTTQAPTTPAPRPTTAASTTPAPRPTTQAPTTPAPRPTTQAPTTQAPTKPAPTKPAPPPAPAPSGKGAIALAWAKTQLGKPYVYGAAGPSTYDCSGLTMRAFQQAGVNLPRNSAAQYNAGSKVSVNNMQPGDLFFYSRNGSPSGIYHVAIYAGNGMRLHAPSPGKSVELVPMWWANVLPLAVRL